MSSSHTRSLLLTAVLFVALVAVGATAAAAGPAGHSAVLADDTVGTDATANETTVDVEFIGTVTDQETVTVGASGVMDNGTPVDGVEATVTVGGEVATTATVTDGELSAEFDPGVLDLAPTDSAEVGLQEYTVTDPATVEVVHEAFELNASTRLRSVPQGAELAVENVTAVTVWDAAAGTYDSVTSPDFETAADFHQGLYISIGGSDARIGYTFDTTASEAGTVALSTGWNFASSNFNISQTTNLTVQEDLDLVSGNVSDLDIYTADFSQQLAPSDTVESFDGYWVFVEDGDQPVERNTVDPAYVRDAREDVLGLAEGNVSFTDQATASSTFTGANPSTPGVVVEAEANVESAVVVTYQNGSDLVIAGLDTFNESELDGSGVVVPVTEFGGFPGNHTAHVIPVDDLSGSYAPGDTVSSVTADAILDNEQATVFQGTVEFDNQSYEDQTGVVTAATASLLGDEDTLFQIDLHAADQNGAPANFVGSSPVLSGANEDVSITLRDTSGNPITFTESDDYVAMIHVVDNESVSEGEEFPPGTFPVLPHASANGIVPGGVTDGGEVGIFSAEGAELNFDGQAIGIDDQGNAVVYVNNLTEAEQIKQEDVSNPAEDFVVIYEGDTLTQDSLVDFRNVGDAQNGELVLDVANATPGEHTVELYADARSSLDPTADDIDADHPMLEVTTGDAASTTDEYLVVLEEDLQLPASADQETAIQTLQQQADLAQAPVVDSIDQLSGATVEQQFWITNAVLVSADGVSAQTLERLDGVEHVVENIEAEHPTPTPTPTAPSTGEVGAMSNHKTYGLEAIDVPGFEEKYDTQGEGIRVAIIDDGLNVSHPDINLTLGVQVANGQIINEPPTITPGSQHGAHVAGTAVGTANPAGDVPRYSVAPGADLLKADIWVGGPTLGDTIAAVQWSVGENADVTSMSLGFGQGLGESTVVPLMADTIQNANDAGTLVIGSAGNEGSGAVGGPVTSPGAEFNSFSVGASAEGGAVAGFSSGTTVTPNDVLLFPAGASYPDYFPREYLKPDVTAPGVSVLSTGPLGSLVAEDPAYSLSSGTSMAAPHAAGAAALVQAATTEQLDPKTIENALAESAEKPFTFFGGQNERDIRYGTGIINVTAATMAAQNTTTISGTITSNATGDALTGVQVSTDTGTTTATDANGNYSLTVTNDSSSTVVTAEEFGFTDETETVPLDAGDQTVDFALDPEVDVVPVVGQPAFAEFQDSFAIVLDVRNLEEYSVDLAGAQGVTPADINVTVAGETISPGENITFDPAVSANGVQVLVEIDGTFSEGDQFALAHTFSGLGDDISVTTGPTTLTENQEPAQFTLSNFDAPSEQPDPGQGIQYAPEVTVTNVGQTPGAAEIRWFAGPLGLAGENPVEQLAPGESTTVSLNFGELNFADIFGIPVEILHGFDAVPQGTQSTGDLAFERFTVGNPLAPLLDPIDPGLARGAAESSTVYAADVSIDNQSDEDATSEVTVSSSDVAPQDEYVVVVHEEVNGAPGQIIGSSGNLTGPQDNVTINLDQELNTTTDVVAMLHFASGSGPFGVPITAFDPAAGGLAPVTDAATVEIAGSTISGNVTASGETANTDQAAGEPIAGANVTLYDGDSTDPADEVASTVTSQSGNYSFAGLSAGNYTVEVSDEEFVTESSLLTVGAIETVTEDFALDYADTGAVSGEITLDQVDPDEDVNVTVTVVETGNSTTVSLAGSDTTTSYTIAGLDVNVGDGYTVSATSDSGNYDDPADETNVTVDVGATTTGVNFTFTRQTGGANGTVVASGETASTQQTPGAGEGVENATIDVYAFQSDDSGSPAFTFTDATGPNGEFDLPTDTFPVGDHFVVVDATNFSSAGLPVTITEGENDLSEIGLDYADGGEITGTLALDTVDPGEDVTVTVTADDGTNTYTDTVTLSGSTDTETYTLSDVDVNVDAGYTVSASSDSANYDGPADATVEVDVGETVTEDFSFTRQTGDLDGTVTNSSGSAIQGATVEVFGFGSGGPLVANDTTDASGAYSIGPLPVGDHFVTVSVDGAVAANATVTIQDDQTTTRDFSLAEGAFTVEFLGDVEAVAGETQSFDIEVQNTGDIITTQTIELDWGDGAFTDDSDVELAGGDTVVETLSVTTSGTQALGFYNVTASSDDDTDTANATIAPGRSFNQTSVQPGDTVEVTVSGTVGQSADVTLADEWDENASDVTEISSTFSVDFRVIESDAVAVLFDSGQQGTFEYVYQIDIPTDAESDFDWDPLQDGDGSSLEVGSDRLPVLGDQVVVVDPLDSGVLLDSVSSLLDENGQPLTTQKKNPSS